MLVARPSINQVFFIIGADNQDSRDRKCEVPNTLPRKEPEMIRFAVVNVGTDATNNQVFLFNNR